MADWETTKFIAGMLQLKLDRGTVETGRTRTPAPTQGQIESRRSRGTTGQTRANSTAIGCGRGIRVNGTSEALKMVKKYQSKQ